MRALLILFLFGLSTNLSFSQAKKSIYDVRNIYDEKGDYYFDKNEFKKSIVYYNMAYQSDANNYYSVLKKAEAFASLSLYDQASESYKILFDTKLDIPNEFRLKFALLLLKNKDIKGFEEWMGRYNDIVHSEIYDYLTATDIRAKMYYDSSIVIVENESVLNTPESEISPEIYQDNVIFASTRKNLTGNAGNDYNLFAADYLDNGQLGRLNLFNTSLNSAQNEISILCSHNTNKLYVTRGKSVNSNLETYVTNIPANANEVLTMKEFLLEGFSSIGQIAFDNEGNTMYFVADAPGGSGGLDIYSTELTGGKWSKPKNLGTGVNSVKDEMYPFILNDTILYFSSAGHHGKGGFDLFSYNLNQKNSSPKNLGSEVNSSYDDYSLTFSSDGLTGYFCSNRPGGFGKEDIYRVHLLNIKVRYPAYRFKKKTAMEDNKINLYLSNGEEYNIASNNSGFSFTFLPEEDYKMVIQHENPLSSNVIYNKKLTEDLRRNEFLNPQPFNKSEIKLQAGMRYLFTLGMNPISSETKNTITETTKDYQNITTAMDLTLLLKELSLEEGEIYSIQFVKGDEVYSDNKSKKSSGIFFNDKTIDVSGESFFIVIPLKNEANFAIATDIAYFKKTFSPKKTGRVFIDTGTVYKEEHVKLPEGFPILVNTASSGEAARKISATELTIIPGTMYILTFGNIDARAEDLGIIIPLTKGVKYNLGTGAESKIEYSKALSQVTSGQAGSNNPGEELIDISVLSKELDILSARDIVFNLMPAKQIGSQNTGARNVLTTLSVDGRKYFITPNQKMQVNLKIEGNEKINLQTDLAYVKENFDPATIAIKVDTTSFNKILDEKKNSIITDPVFDLVIINFSLNDYSIRPEAKSTITNKVIEALRSDSRLYVTVKGYTDPLGDAAHNEKLSKNRAQAVKDFLINNGIGESRIRTFSYGATQALKEGVNWKDLSESELEKYRKVEIVIYLPK